MKNIILILLLLQVTSCGYIESKLDECRYKSIIGKSGTLYFTIGGKPVTITNIQVEYSNSDASTLLIIDSSGNYLYLQGPAVISFNDKNLSLQSSINEAVNTE